MTLDEFVESLREEQDMGDGMALVRFVTPSGEVYEARPPLDQRGGCPGLVRIPLRKVEVEERHREFLTGTLPNPAKPFSPCPSCGKPVTIARCLAEHSRWYGGWQVLCVPCGMAYTGADLEREAKAKARNLEKHYP